MTAALIAHVAGFEIEAAGALASRGRLPVLIIHAEVHAGETVAGLAIYLKLRRGGIFDITRITDLRRGRFDRDQAKKNGNCREPCPREASPSPTQSWDEAEQALAVANLLTHGFAITSEILKGFKKSRWA
ncbi:hypothetical protein ABENE_13845 [Asticcacaulis benevestitus DSM 16100 = ATCC BAA-896]|uniref:Uncharacterized protein n=1 Tax=Asticcacaulis benevestitus DSM 16100 = ATCC BAA-896 TaxID=1121022 RepID=V4P668_9CAUL|nr:hypothetical protein ABENE_13845 [Asticcacaulis benevestitus DSM 16100 = ATCC BAA-896]